MASTRVFRSLCTCLIALTCVLLAAPVIAQSPVPLALPDLQLVTNGFVYAIARQPDGGVVFGGNFSSVNGVARNNIARLMPDGTLDPDWNPSSNDDVRALALGSDGVVYAGGRFGAIGGRIRPFVAKLSGTGTGAADATWNPSPDSYVYSLAISSSGALYAGGQFSVIGGLSRNFIAKLSAGDAGAVDAIWNPSPNELVHALAVDSTGVVFVGGGFTEIGGQPRDHVAKLSGSGTGTAHPAWSPSANDAVSALAVDSSGAVYLGGKFTRIGELKRNRIAKLSADGVADKNWNPSADNEVFSLALDSSGAVYAGGNFSHIGGQSRSRIAKLSGTGGGMADANWNPSADSRVDALAIAPDGVVYAGGAFTHAGGQPHLGLAIVDSSGGVGEIPDAESAFASVLALGAQPDGGMIVGGNFQKANGLHRKNLLRLQPDGALDPNWNPSTNDVVQSLAVDRVGAVYAGGSFTSVGTQSRNYIAKFAGNGVGALDATWNPLIERTLFGGVFALALDHHGALYAGGQFTSVGALPRGHIAKLSVNGTGTVDANWNPSADDEVLTLTLDDAGAVYAGGWFRTIGGMQRERIAKLDSGGIGAADVNWNPSANRIVRTLALGNDGALYAGGRFTSIGGQVRSRIAKLSSLGVGAADSNWNPSASDDVYALSVDSSGAVYAGGFFSTIGSPSRSFIAKLSGTGSGAVDASWNLLANNGLSALVQSRNGNIHAGGVFTTIGGQSRQRLAAFQGINPQIFEDGFE